jgi:hypothetical protein
MGVAYVWASRIPRVWGYYMRARLTVLLFILLALVLGAGQSFATVLTFDDLDTTNDATGYGAIPDGYGGFNWSGVPGSGYGEPVDFAYLGKNYMDLVLYIPESGYENTIEGKAGAYNDYAGTVSLGGGGGGGALFTFNGAKFGAAWNDDLQLDLVGSKNGSPLYSTTLTLQVTGDDFDLDWAGIDELSFKSYGGSNHGYYGGGDHFVMDNFDYTAAPGLPAFALIGAAPIVGGIVRRWRKR